MLRLNETKTLVAMARIGFNTVSLSAKSGVSRQTISYALAGKRIRTDVVAKLAVALGVDVADIIEKED